MTFGYRHAEVNIPVMAVPDPTYCLRYYDVRDSDRKPARISLGCHLLGAANPVPDRSHAPSQMEGAIKRVATAMPQIDRATLRRLKRFTIRFLEKEFAGLQFDPNEEFEFDDYIEETNYTRARKENLRTTHSVPFDPIKGKNVKMFTKDENYPSYKAFRLINSRSDDYKTRVGPFFQKFGRKIFSSKFFIKKIPVNDRPAWLKSKFADKPNLFCTDFTSFEATFVRLLLKVEFQVYAWFLKYNKHKWKILNLITRVIGGVNYICAAQWAYKIACKRMSGEMNTSEGNGIMNLILTAFLLEEAGNRYTEMAVEGDDGIVDYDVRPPTAAEYARVGANIKIEIPKTLSEASFCGMIFDPDVLDNVCDPLDALMSFGYTTDQYCNSTDSKMKALLRSKSLSLLYQYPGCPIIRSLGLYGMRMTSSIDDEYMWRTISKSAMCGYDRDLISELRVHFNHGHVASKIVDYRTRLLVERKFNIPVELQLQTEAYLDGLNFLQPLNLPLIVDLINPDCQHYFSTYSRYIEPKSQNNTMPPIPGRPYRIYKSNVIYEDISYL